MVVMSQRRPVTVTFAGSGDAFGSGGRFQACIHLRGPAGAAPVLLDCGATSLSALRRCGLDPAEVAAVFVSHLHGDHFGGLPFLILNAQFSGRTAPLRLIGPPGISRRLAALMECLFPGSSTVARRFPVDVTELPPGGTAAVAEAAVRVAAWAADHPSGAPALALRLAFDTASGGTETASGGTETVVGYTGDTAWTGDLTEVAAGADLLIAEAYYRSKPVPYHLRHADLVAHRADLACRRVVLTHMSDDMLDHLDQAAFETASDGLVLHL
jgi:ribonuclease BN (tRNA processing enzyme)